ncbi:hypothetical protein BDY19DRAFT_921678 [Irpex rosettiformis]|uniref:Uncharacterized protein n=1 Tax=Irpex rosettiformis TaxID=378272 RepID=A0ACB8UF40_9APHY|nr:hypothetical protein BDY19DRAFT_921678 [Irpex rosettiformis]
MVQSNDQPPNYDTVVMTEAHSCGPYVPAGTTDAKDVKIPLESPETQNDSPASGPPPTNFPSMPATTVYNYRNPMTGDIVCSLLPPDHPQMICLQQGHVLQTKFGMLGILAAIFWFPLGIGLCLLDRKVYCSRCGQLIDDSICG